MIYDADNDAMVALIEAKVRRSLRTAGLRKLATAFMVAKGLKEITMTLSIDVSLEGEDSDAAILKALGISGGTDPE